MLCYVMLCHVMSCCVMLSHVMLCHVVSCYVMLCYVMLCYVMLLCHVMLRCYVMLCYVMLCYVMLCYVRNSDAMIFIWEYLMKPDKRKNSKNKSRFFQLILFSVIYFYFFRYHSIEDSLLQWEIALTSGDPWVQCLWRRLVTSQE